MKLLFDHNLSPRLKQLLASEFPDCLHVVDAALEAVDDEVVWEYARDHGYAILSKDSDFQHLAVRFGPPPKAIWLRTGNRSTMEMAALLLSFLQNIREFEADQTAGLLVLG
jgi:predicted nuclease of predicted toxin-antitoxin system